MFWSGITPMYQLIKEICKHPEDDTKLQLLFANQASIELTKKQDISLISLFLNDCNKKKFSQKE